MNLKELAKARGTNLKRIAEQTGIPRSTLYAISQGETNFDNVGISTFITLAQALDMPVERVYELPSIPPEKIEEYILSLDDDETVADSATTPDESALLSSYRALDARDKERLLEIARVMAGGR